MSNIILASASPRRKDLLQLVVNQFEIQVADIDEARLPEEKASDYVPRLALSKAEVIARKFPDSFVIGADTTVALEDRTFAKPQDKQQAREFLQELSGKKHQVHSAYCIICINQEISIVKSFATDVEFININEKDLEEYLETEEPYDKAGAYALQGIAAKFIKKINGNHTGVIGLNISELSQDLRKLELI